MMYRVFMRSDEDLLALSCPVGSFESEAAARTWVRKHVAEVFRPDCILYRVGTTRGSLVLFELAVGM